MPEGQNQPPDYLSRAEMKDLIEEVSSKAVKETLVSLGISAADPMEMQKDMAFVRDLRKMNDNVKSISLKGVVGLLITATGALLIMGIRYWIVRK